MVEFLERNSARSGFNSVCFGPIFALFLFRLDKKKITAQILRNAQKR